MSWLDSLISKTGINKQENFRKQQLEYLRNELNQRLNLSYDYTNKLFGHILFLWGGTLVLFGTNKGDFLCIEHKLFIMATIFFISVVVIHLLSHRNSENMIQISKVAAHIAIFYEEIPQYGKHDRIFWELATFEINKEEMGKSQWGKLRNKFKNEYFWLSLMATIAIIIVFIVMKMHLCISDVDTCFDDTKIFDRWMFIGCICYIVISTILSFVILTHLSLNWEKWSDTEKDYLRKFMKYAIEMNGYTENDIKVRYGEKFYKAVVGKKLRRFLERRESRGEMPN
jgi:hypothetical protein